MVWLLASLITSASWPTSNVRRSPAETDQIGLCSLLFSLHSARKDMNALEVLFESLDEWLIVWANSVIF